MSRRRTNPRFRFLSGTELKLRAREQHRRRYLTPEAARAKTVRIERREVAMSNPKRKYGSAAARYRAKAKAAYARLGGFGKPLRTKYARPYVRWEDKLAATKKFGSRRNPKRGATSRRRTKSRFHYGFDYERSKHYSARRSRRNPGVFATVSEAVRAFKHQYGGQAVGWAQDAVSTARTSETARFWERVVMVLRRDMYRTNPKRSRSYRPVGRMRHNWKEGANRKGRAGARSTLKKRLRRAERRDVSWRSNPKRDGTPTRGERRGDKYKDHLRKLRERGQKAADELNKLLGRGAAAPVGHAEPAFKAPKTETQEAHPGHYAAAESAEQRFAKEQLANINALMGDIRDQLRDIGDDETLADGLSEQLVKLAKQRKALMDLSTPAMSNPRRRAGRFRFRRLHPARMAAYRRALRELRSTVRSL